MLGSGWRFVLSLARIIIAPQVDTDVDSVLPSENSSDDDGWYGGNEIKLPLKKNIDDVVFHKLDEVPQPKPSVAAGPRASTRKQPRETLWENDYFYIPKARDGIQGIRILMRPWTKNSLGSEDNISKYMTPSHVQETLDYAPITIILLRAWGIWRVCRDGWATANSCRTRHFEEDWLSLQKEIQKIKTSNGGSLGARADILWDEYHSKVSRVL